MKVFYFYFKNIISLVIERDGELRKEKKNIFSNTFPTEKVKVETDFRTGPFALQFLGFCCIFLPPFPQSNIAVSIFRIFVGRRANFYGIHGVYDGKRAMCMYVVNVSVG